MLRRGILKAELKSFQSAEQDILASLKLAPTQIAYIKLGEISEETNQCAQAQRYYQQAAQAAPQNQQALQQRVLALRASCGR